MAHAPITHASPKPLIVTVDALPPTVNHLYEGMGNSRRLTPAAQAFRKELGLVARNAAQWQDWTYTLGTYLELTMWLTFEQERAQQDGDNRYKFTQDVLAEVLDFNDTMVKRGTWIDCGVQPREPRTTIRLAPLVWTPRLARHIAEEMSTPCNR
jgi:hypothetical protein